MDDPLPSGEINDLETARLALHGLLARNRSMQELNQRLKEEVRDALNREKIALARAEESRADKRITVLEHIVESAQRAQKAKEKEVYRLQEDLQRKDKIIKELQQEAESSRIRQRAELTAMAERSRAEIREKVAEATADQEAVIQGLRLHSMQQIEAMQDHCRQFEAALTKKEQILTKDFLERNEALAGQWKAREDELWQQSKKMQERLQADVDALLLQRLAALDLERQKDKEALSQKMAELEAQFLQRRADLQGEFEAREKRLREAYQQNDHDMQKRLARREPSQEQLRLQEKAALEKQARHFEEQWLAREAVIRGEYENIAKDLRLAYEKSAREMRAQHKEALVTAETDWMARLKIVQAEVADELRQERQSADAREGQARAEHAARYEAALAHWQRIFSQQSERLAALELERARAEEENNQWRVKMGVFTTELQRTQEAARIDRERAERAESLARFLKHPPISPPTPGPQAADEAGAS